MKHIASISFGKDSLAMVLRLLEEGRPLDEVVFYDTGMEFDAIYRNRDKLRPVLREHGVALIEMAPKKPFIYSMLERPIRKLDGGIKYGYGWCGGPCRWGTGEKTYTVNRYIRQQKAVVYVGIAADEQYRMKRAENQQEYKKYPLIDWGMSETDCRGWNWQEGDIDLYDILDRVSCWCCCNKNRRELCNIYRYLPEYWQRLKDLQLKIPAPMKKYCSRKYGSYGNLFDMEKVFEKEIREMSD